MKPKLTIPPRRPKTAEQIEQEQLQQTLAVLAQRILQGTTEPADELLILKHHDELQGIIQQLKIYFFYRDKNNL